jgi:hypothetical protein
MNKMLMYLACIFGLLLACGLDVTTLIGYVTGAIIVVGLVRYLFMKELPENFWSMLFGVFFGPFLLASLLRAVCRAVWNCLTLTLGFLAPALLIIGILLISFLAFLYVRSRFALLLGDDDKQNFISERKPVLPPHQEEDDNLIWTESEKELDSHKEYSDED